MMHLKNKIFILFSTKLEKSNKSEISSQLEHSSSYYECFTLVSGRTGNNVMLNNIIINK